MVTFLLWSLGGLAVLVALYALHRLALWLEHKGLLYYWHKQPQSGSASSVLGPLQQFAEPQIRHVVEVREQRRLNAADEGNGDDALGKRWNARNHSTGRSAHRLADDLPSGHVDAAEWSVP